MQKFMCTRRIIQLASFLVFSPSLLQASSLWISNNKRRIDHDLWTDHTSNVVDDFQYVGQQILFLEKLISKVSQPSAYNKRVEYQDSRTPWYNEVHSNHLENRISPDYDDEDKQFEHKKKIWQASLILGSVGWAFGKLGLISVISPRLVVQDTATSTSSSSVPAPTILTTTTPTTTSTTTMMPATTTKPTTATTTTTKTSTNIAPVTCSTTTSDASGTYKTIRTPGPQVAQCLSITVAVGSRIKITCRAVYTQSGTYTKFYDNSGTAIVTTSPVVNQVYTTTDNTLIIESLAHSSASSALRCKWTSVE